MSEPNLDALWMPFTANRQFKAAPRMLVAADGVYYTDDAGRSVLDGTSGLWCVNAGHNRRPIVEAVQRQVACLDYAPPFQMGHPLAFEAATALAEMAPTGLDRVFFVNSGSEAAETALKIALSYHRARGEAGRVKLIGRERGYHGVNFGGMAVGGIAGNRKHFSVGLPGIDHLRHPLDIARNAFSTGLPLFGAELAEEFEQRLLTLHDPSTVAALIVEPMQGSAGVILPPVGYLRRLREICDKYGILLIFDEVITGFGRLGADWASNLFAVKPDLLTCAKGLTNGMVPMGAVLARRDIHDTLLAASAQPSAVEFPHGYTYSAHPLACAAALATLRLYRDEALFQRGADLAPGFGEAAHALRGLPNLRDIRNLGLVAGIELEPRPGMPGQRGYEVFLKCWERGVLVRQTGDIIAVSPPLIYEASHVDRLFSTLADALRATE
ncbi:aspartate aminotransferase family protein [Paludibacterium yongneupense]|uniref:aspartate aminotransferase family protein n=1 Tax=Paludibacterium yongneupense TaxID=400061 RepID=UPI000418BC51|nr:aspartate aminotransferase family protein [Paludibacterium yongneupense]